MNASTAIIVIVLVVIGAFAVKSYIRRLSVGCCGSGGDVEKRTAHKPSDLSIYKYRAKLDIDGMSCKNCAIHVENALCKIEGVYARVNLKKNQADVYMLSPVDDSELKKAVLHAGYEVKCINRS